MSDEDRNHSFGGRTTGRRVRTNLDSCEAEECGFSPEKAMEAVTMQVSPLSAKPLPKPRPPASATPPHRIAPQDRLSADCRALLTEPQGTASPPSSARSCDGHSFSCSTHLHEHMTNTHVRSKFAKASLDRTRPTLTLSLATGLYWYWYRAYCCSSQVV